MIFKDFFHSPASQDGLRCEHVVDCGGGPNTVVFLHGLFGSPSHWSQVVESLAQDFRLIAPQLPIDRSGNRRSHGARTISDLTDAISGLMDEKQIQEPFVLCGNSLGGLIAMDYALRNSDRVCGLVLAGSAGLYERSLTNGVKPKPTKEFVRSVISDIFYDQAMISDALVDEWYELIQDRDYARFILRISRATRDRNVEEELHQLTTPTLIVWGKEDEITPPNVANQFHQKIPNAELHFFDRCGHVPNLEQPALFIEHLKKFLPKCFAVS